MIKYSLIIFLAQFMLFAQDKPVVAVLDFNNYPNFQQTLEDHLNKSQYIKLLSRNDWYNLLSQTVNRSKFVPTNTNAAVKMGEIINVDYIVYGNSREGFISINLIDIANRSKVISIRRRFNGNQLAYYDIVPEIINSLDQKLSDLTDFKQTKKIFAPPMLKATLKFYEPSGNNSLDAEESGTITVMVTNSGKGEAKNISFNISPRSISGLSFSYNHEIGDLEPGNNKKIQIPISADFHVQSKSVKLEFSFKEKNDFEPDGMKLAFNTKAFLPPELIVVNGLNIDDPEGEGIVKTGVVVAITAAIQNIGQGKAKIVTVKLNKGQNVNWGELNHDFSLGTLNPGEMKEFTFDIFANKKATEIPIFVSISESYGKFGSKDIRLPIEFKKKVTKIREVEVIGIESGNINITRSKGFDIDIEKNIPKTGMVNKDAIAVVIGNREYESGIPMVDFAVRDAQFVKEYLIQTLGYREGNIIHYKNATLSNIKVAFNKLKGYVKKGKSDVFVYYSGHGAPDPETNQGYLVPVDADPNFIEDSGYPVNELYSLLNDVNAKSLTVVIDACFSGASDGGMILKDISPVFIEVDQSSLRGKNATLFTSATGEQVSSWYREKKHSLFTYYFLKALQGEGDENKDDKLTFAEIQSYIDDKVPYMARRLNNREQTPQLDTMDKNRVLVQY